ETVTRRRLMGLTVHTAGGITAAAFTLPALGFALGPLFSRVPFEWQPIGAPSDFPNNTYVTKVITIVPGIGETGKSIAYVRARNPAIDTEHEDQYNHYVALSSRCMHLGCPVRFVAAASRFICPCHGGVYDFRGMRAGGPPAAEAGITVVDWLDERTSLSPGLRWMLFRKVPRGINWAYTLGSATMFAFLSQAVTGVFLAMYYRPDATGGAYESIRYITDD